MFDQSPDGPLDLRGLSETETGGADDTVPLPEGSPVGRRDAAVVFAAGKGTRMRSSLPKVLHKLAGKPMLLHVLDSLTRAGFVHPSVVVGYGAEHIVDVAGDRCNYVHQEDQRGTGHAALVAVTALPESTERVLVLHGDEPMIGAELLVSMLTVQRETGAAVVLLTTRVNDTRSFGRVIRDDHLRPVALRQESDLVGLERDIDEVNLGAYVFDAGFLRRHLPKLQAHPPKEEYYLTDLIEIAVDESGPGSVAAVLAPGGVELMGVNDLMHLEEANRMLYRRTNRRLMESGVTIVDSAATYIDEDVRIDSDTVIHPGTTIHGSTWIAGQCEIGPNTRIVASTIGERCRVLMSVVEESIVGNDVTIGPYAHLRPGAQIGNGAEIGNYAEIKKSIVGPETKMHHFSYLGDAQVGARVNIGAGTITCNFDGTRKWRTVIEDDAFIGSDTMLRAPVTIGRGAVTGAGSVVIRDVLPGSTVIGAPAHRIKRTDEETTESPESKPHGRSGA